MHWFQKAKNTLIPILGFHCFDWFLMSLTSQAVQHLPWRANSWRTFLITHGCIAMHRKNFRRKRIIFKLSSQIVNGSNLVTDEHKNHSKNMKTFDFFISLFLSLPLSLSLSLSLSLPLSLSLSLPLSLSYTHSRMHALLLFFSRCEKQRKKWSDKIFAKSEECQWLRESLECLCFDRFTQREL